MYSFINSGEINIDNECRLQLKVLYDLYIEHKFDLLGSGYVKVDYRLNAKGFRKKKYVSRLMPLCERIAKAKLKNKCNADYEPINWFVDYKSGFFFSPWVYSSQKRCYKVMQGKKGVDIKCPWELGRFYHLPQLAVLATDDINIRKTIIQEFRNEIIDFIEMNPVGKTVQWSAPMDVSIRIVNLLVSYDILMQLDKEGALDKQFQIYFEKHISDTLKFVMTNLEYIDRASTNHYLSNIAGIVFAAAYLPQSDWINACLAFGVQELIAQVGKQFYEEGSHFEGSTSYHRLSAEFVLYSVALIYGVLNTDKRRAFSKYESNAISRLKNRRLQQYRLNSAEFFPVWFIDKLYNAGIFTKTILKSNNEIVQIGDNDSGRLLKLTPMLRIDDKDIEEIILDHRTLLSALSGLFVNKEFIKYEEELPLESSIIRSLTKWQKIKGNLWITRPNEHGIDIKETYNHSKKSVLFHDEENNLMDELAISYFAKFGVIVLRGRRLFLSMVIDTAQNTIYTGHTHNDKLSIEIMIDGKYITRDPGGYIYTADPGLRDKFRSVRAHNVISIEGCEQNNFDGIWRMKKRARAELLYYAKDRIVAKLTYGDNVCMRDIMIKKNEIIVMDYCNKPFQVAFRNRIFSDGYGKLKRR